MGNIGTPFRAPPFFGRLADARWRAGACLLTIFALLYLATLDNGLRPGELLGGDLITHQYAQVQGRPGNAPGYPLYTMGGWLWFHAGRLLFGATANPISLLAGYSTLWALTALGLLYAVILEIGARRGREGDWLIAFLVTMFYGVTYFFWYYAVTTEQYASSVAWTLAVIWLALRWDRERRDGQLLALAGLAGVALAHQVTLPLILPPILWWVWRAEPRLLRRPRLIAAAIGLALLPLTSYLYVFLAGARHPEWRGAGEWASTWEWFWSFVSTSQGRAELTWSWTPFFTPTFPALIWRELTVPGLVAGLLGWATLGRRPAGALYSTAFLYLILCWIDRLGNWYQVIMPLYALLAMGIAAGAEWLISAGRRGSRSALRVLLLAALILLTLYRAALSVGPANARNRPDDTGLAPGWAILADDPPVGAAILGTLPEAAALDYLTIIWGRRPDLRSITSEQARTLLAQGATVVATRAALPLVAQEVSANAHYSALGRTLIRITATPARTPPPGLQAWKHDFSPTLRLAGGKVYRDTVSGEPVALLVWETSAQPTEDWAVSVRLTQAGREIAQVDHQHPVFGAYPMRRWSAGEVVADAYPLPAPPDAQADGLTVILYRRLADGSFVNLGAARLPL